MLGLSQLCDLTTWGKSPSRRLTHHILACGLEHILLYVGEYACVEVFCMSACMCEEEEVWADKVGWGEKGVFFFAGRTRL